MSTHTDETPSEGAVEQGHVHVHVDGPGAVAVSLTPNAAHKTADRLTVAAREADGQGQGEVHPDGSNVEDIPPDTPSL